MTDRRRPGRNRSTARCMLCVLGLGLAGAWLVLLVPVLFRPGAEVGAASFLAPVLLVVACAAGARYWRPAGPRADGR